nr:hypothetical protein BaRGS_018239 [Batillaria attramentaria]
MAYSGVSSSTPTVIDDDIHRTVDDILKSATDNNNGETQLQLQVYDKLLESVSIAMQKERNGWKDKLHTTLQEIDRQHRASIVVQSNLQELVDSYGIVPLQSPKSDSSSGRKSTDLISGLQSYIQELQDAVERATKNNHLEAKLKKMQLEKEKTEHLSQIKEKTKEIHWLQKELNSIKHQLQKLRRIVLNYNESHSSKFHLDDVETPKDVDSSQRGVKITMNEAQRNILHRYRKKLADDIIVTEEFLAQLSEQGIFEWGMISVIKAEKTESEQIYKLLELLPKRGPHAFDKFVTVLERDYPWLAVLLLSSNKTPVRENTTRESTQHDIVSVENHRESPRRTELCDSDIKKLVATFVHRHFGQSKRISEKDKKSVEKFISEQLQQERVRYQSMLSSAHTTTCASSVSDGDDDVFQSAEVQEHLFRIHMKIERHLNDNEENNNSVRDRILPDDLTFETIHKEMDLLAKKIYRLEREIQTCMGYFKPEVHDTPLSELVGKMHEVLRKQQRELTEQQDQTQRLLDEVDGYSNHIEKLEKERQEYRLQINALHQDMGKLRQEKMTLVDRCAHLEKVNRQHIEKENTLDNLRSIMKDFSYDIKSKLSENFDCEVEDLQELSPDTIVCVCGVVVVVVAVVMVVVVVSEDNYVAKAHKLMELLPKRGPKAFSTLLEILEITNPWLAEKMKSALHEERNREAKLKISSSVSESASIEGYGAASRQTIDNDLRATARRFVKSSLQHLTDSEQRSTEQWLGEELQRERRKQQFRTPHTIRRHPQEFLSSKEVQTEMKGMELQELCEDLMVQLHELLSRVHKMDFLFIQCLEKFDDVDKYALALPDLIERSMMRQKELVRALMDDRRKIQRLTEDRDSLDRHIRRLEEDFERLLKTPSQKAIHPQQMYLKKRKELQERILFQIG